MPLHTGLPIMLAALLCLTFTSESSLSDDPAKPNVLFLIADDLNCDLGCYGHPRVKSPNIDRLAADGVLFKRAYCQNPLCSPSRTSFLTGRLPSATGIYHNPGNRVPKIDQQAEPILNKVPYTEKLFRNTNERPVHFRETVPDTVTLPQRFKNAGYFSARVGKLYHYNVPGGTNSIHDMGTDGLDDRPSWHHVVNPAGRDVVEQHKIFSIQPGSFGGTLSWMASEGTDHEQTDGLAATAAIGLLNRTPAKDRKADGYAGDPFFLAVGFYRPHTPYVALKSDFEQYPAADVVLPDLSEMDKKRNPPEHYLSKKKAADEMDPALRPEAIRAYHASITLMDRQVGRVLDELERLGLDDSTIVVMTSDHGYHMYEHGLWQKRSLFENATRVPLIVRVPEAVREAAKRGETTDALAGLIDLYPTLADLAGLDAPEYLDGVSLVPVLDDPSASVRESVPSVSDFGKIRGRSVRTDRYRFSQYVHLPTGDVKAEVLFDLRDDPGETQNVVTDADAETLAKLRNLTAAPK